MVVWDSKAQLYLVVGMIYSNSSKEVTWESKKLRAYSSFILCEIVHYNTFCRV